MESIVKYKGTDVFCLRSGSGPAVVLLHGFLEDHSMWNEFVPALQTDHCVISIDLLGHGQSRCTGYVHGMEEQADAVKAVFDEQHVGACVLIGHSMGGYVALAFAKKYPDMIDGLVLFHSTALADTKEKLEDRQRTIKMVQQHKELFIRQALPSLFAPQNLERCRARADMMISAASAFSTQGIIANIRGMMERQDMTEVLRDTRFRTMIVHGELDPVISLGSILTQIGDGSTAVIKELKNVGHMAHLEASEECRVIFSEFCRTVTA